MDADSIFMNVIYYNIMVPIHGYYVRAHMYGASNCLPIYYIHYVTNTITFIHVACMTCTVELLSQYYTS